MGAEINNYFQVEARFRGSNHVEMKINPAKAQWSLAQIKSFFYLDDVIAFTANYAGTMYHGFWGTCIVGSQNEMMHVTNRRVDVFGSTLGQSKRTFNDCGLNTLALIQNLGFVTSFANRLRVNIKSKSSYFDHSSRYGVRYRKPGETTWREWNLSNTSRYPAKTEFTAIEQLGMADLQENTVFEFKFFIVNPEGTYESAVQPELMLPYVYEDVFTRRASACSARLNNVVLYYPTRTRDVMPHLTAVSISNDYFAYKDIDMTTEADTGFYTSTDGWTYYYNTGVGFQNRGYCQDPAVTKLTLGMTVRSNYTWTLNATRTEFLLPQQDATISGLAVGRDENGYIVSSVYYSITLGVNQESSVQDGYHDADYVSQLMWSFGVFTISGNNSLVQGNISGIIGIG